MKAGRLTQPAGVTAAYAATVGAQVAILGVLNMQIDAMHKQVQVHFLEHPDVQIYLSQPPRPAPAIGANSCAHVLNRNDRCILKYNAAQQTPDFWTGLRLAA